MLRPGDIAALRRCQGAPVDPLCQSMRRLEDAGAVRIIASYNPEHYGARLDLVGHRMEWVGGDFSAPVLTYSITSYGGGLLNGEIRRAG